MQAFLVHAAGTRDEHPLGALKPAPCWQR
jgi:hypothetical protein